MPELPLEGIRIVDFTVVIAGPAATAKLADMGAEVIRIESIQEIGTGARTTRANITKEQMENSPIQRRSYPDGDPGERPWNRSASFNGHGRNKLCMTVDLKKPEGMEVLRKLVEQSDVLIENHATDYMERKGITYDWLKSIKPDIVLVRMPGWGTDGPYAYWRTFGSTAEGHVGRSALSGYQDLDSSHIPWVFPADANAGTIAAFATTAALYHAKRTGKGQMIDLALGENLLNILGAPFLDYTMNGRIMENPGNRHPYAAPHGVYRAKGEDRWINITVMNDEEWDGFRDALGNPDWVKDAKFVSAISRWENQDELDAHVQAWTEERDHFEMMHLLQSHGVAAGPIMDARDAVNDPHLAERGYYEEVYHPEIGTKRQPGMFFKFSETPLGIRRHTPRLGEDNEYVYKELLGYSQAEYDQFERDGHIGMDYAPHVP